MLKYLRTSAEPFLAIFFCKTVAEPPTLLLISI